MLSVEEALTQVLAVARPLAPVQLGIDDALDRVLAEEVTADLDSPPWDKSMVDGYAVCAADLAGGVARLTVIEEVRAGAVPRHQIRPGQTIRIMTGAPIPEGADAVVMVERSLAVASRGADTAVPELVDLDDAKIRLGQNILRQGCAMRRGETVLAPGVVLRPIEIGLLCELGRATVAAQRAVRVAILSTGDELVPPAAAVGPGQIRNSNGPMLAACVARAGAQAINLGIARDERQHLKTCIEQALTADVVVLSGGVSAGVVDFVPSVLAELGVERVFHKVRVKPGKPLWFGVARHQAGDRLVFGLPGNPVGSLVCFELFVRPALARLAGQATPTPVHPTARLIEEFVHRGDRPTYFPGKLREEGGHQVVAPLRWQGSADLRGLVGANALIAFPAGDTRHAAGDLLPVLRLE